MRGKDTPWAMACAVPADSKGVIHVSGSPAGNIRRLFKDLDIDFGNPRYDIHASTLVIFDDIFVPWDYAFM